MALYMVQRTDDVQPGVFASAVVVAKGSALARSTFYGHPGVTRKNLKAIRLETVNTNYVVTAEYDEREPLAPELPLTEGE
jgi:hypothetical protein